MLLQIVGLFGPSHFNNRPIYKEVEHDKDEASLFNLSMQDVALSTLGTALYGYFG